MHTSDPAADDYFEFSPEINPVEGESEKVVNLPIIVLSVDDDARFQRSLGLALAGFRYQGRELRFITEGSAEAAARRLVNTPDIAVVLLDVVMETDDAGLRLVRNIREVLGNSEVRILLMTGQPGVAPMQSSLDQLDISDYWIKTDLTQERLHGILTGNLRTWEQIHTLNRAKRGLQAIVEASSSLTRAKGLQDFSTRMIRELSRLLGVPSDGMVCVQLLSGEDPLHARIVSAAGRFALMSSLRLEFLGVEPIRNLIVEALTSHAGLETSECQVLFFPGVGDAPHAAVYLATGRHLDETEHELLKVFATHIHSGLINVALTSRLDRIAYEDTLLAIPNGNALLRELESILALKTERDRFLLLVDLDQYAQSSLSLGMRQGDLILQGMARRLGSEFPPPCLVARLHEDTFAIVGPGSMVSHEHINALEMPSDTGDSPLIGIGAARLDLDIYRGSARGAIAAGLLLLKSCRKGSLAEVVEYQLGMEHETSQRLQQSHSLYKALQESTSIRIALQAQVELDTGRIIGAEALVRWTDENGMAVPPALFIPIAEANGLIVPLGKLVLEMACEALKAIEAAGFPELTVAVNVSPLQLVQKGFADEIIATVARHGIAPHRMEIEITESAAMSDQQADGNILRGLKKAGFPIAIDDFGTGYSSLSYLHTLSASTLKIDQRFVHEIGVIPDEQNITDMIIGLGKRMKLDVLAEGVETEAQAQWLERHGCQRAQGYFFARPEPLAAFLARLQTQPR